MSDYENKVFGLLKGIDDEYAGMSRKEMQDSEKRVPDFFDDWLAMNEEVIGQVYLDVVWDVDRGICVNMHDTMRERLLDIYNQYVEGF